MCRMKRFGRRQRFERASKFIGGIIKEKYEQRAAARQEEVEEVEKDTKRLKKHEGGRKRFQYAREKEERELAGLHKKALAKRRRTRRERRRDREERQRGIMTLMRSREKERLREAANQRETIILKRQRELRRVFCKKSTEQDCGNQ